MILDHDLVWPRGGRRLRAASDGGSSGASQAAGQDKESGNDAHHWMGELEALSVELELRRWGIGSLLMEEVERRLAAADIGFIGLAVIAGNEDALRFYRRWGMAPSYVRCLGRTLPGGGR